MSDLSVLAFKSLTPEQLRFIQENYPTIYEEQNKKLVKENYLKKLKEQIKLTKTCNQSNIPNLSKTELIQCLRKKNNQLFGWIQKNKKINYKDFISTFFSCTVNYCNKFTIDWLDGFFQKRYSNTNINRGIHGYSILRNYCSNILEDYPISDKYRLAKCVLDPDLTVRHKTLQHAYSRRRRPDGSIITNTTQAVYTISQFVKIIKIFFPDFRKKYPVEYNDILEKSKSDAGTLSAKKMQNFLLYIGGMLSYDNGIIKLIRKAKSVRDRTRLLTLFELDMNMRKNEVKLTSNQIDEFLEVLTKEQLINILQPPPTVLPPEMQASQGIVRDIQVPT